MTLSGIIFTSIVVGLIGALVTLFVMRRKASEPLLANEFVRDWATLFIAMMFLVLALGFIAHLVLPPSWFMPIATLVTFSSLAYALLGGLLTLGYWGYSKWQWDRKWEKK